jgi:hypothetical protein
MGQYEFDTQNEIFQKTCEGVKPFQQPNSPVAYCVRWHDFPDGL